MECSPLIAVCSRYDQLPDAEAVVQDRARQEVQDLLVGRAVGPLLNLGLQIPHSGLLL